MADSSKLIESLYALSAKSPKLVKSSQYTAPADKNIQVTSWKMNEFKYYDVPSPFPTLARGLFSTTVEHDEEIKYQIVARGYDKFFNIGEVPWTNWRAIERHTVAPYTLTLKSNGCIIFIAALSPDKLLVTSKHSLGPVPGADESHAEVGERWLKRHLDNAGKTQEDLAAYLWEKQWTAVAELCDDSFEEHVLPISSDMTGLHLHGLNANVGEFATQAQPVVDAFAEEWGFIKTASIVLDSERAVREFTQETAKTGKWNGVAVEGFVVRTTIGPRPEDEQKDTPPYLPGSSFFFKVKFDEPYMMYRDWREITKSLLSAKARGNIEDAKISKARMKRKETVVYKHWVQREIIKHPDSFAMFPKNKGIIAIRDKFFKWLETPEGQEASAHTDVTIPRTSAQGSGKAVIVPIAIPGSGKTAISVALAHLFQFGHTQSDNFPGKKTADPFQKSVANLLKIYDVVIADRNNHLTQHRSGIRKALSDFTPNPLIIALHWSLDQLPKPKIHRIVADRVLSRGDNHQSLRPENVEFEETIWRFLKESEDLTEDEADEVIEMLIDESLEDSIARAVAGIVEILGLEKPSDEQMGEALRIALEYKVDVKKNSKKASKAPLAPRYYAVIPELDITEFIGGIFSSNPEIPDSLRAFWEHLKSKKRITERPHITISHTKSKDENLSLWKACDIVTRQEAPPNFQFKFSYLLWNDRVMTIVVEDLRVVEGSSEEAGNAFLESLKEDLKQRLHVTVATREPSIPPVEGKFLVEAWRKGEQVDVLVLSDQTGQGRVKGLLG